MTPDRLHGIMARNPHALKRARGMAGLTQRGLAAELDIGYSTIFHWEQGQRLPTGLYLKLLAKWWPSVTPTP